MADKSVDDMDLSELEDLSPAEIEARLEGDDGSSAAVQPADPRGDPSSAEEERERGSSRPSRETERVSQPEGEQAGSEGEGDTPAGSEQETGSEDSPDSDDDKPVEAADGKHTIPNGVLKSARKEVQRLKQELASRDEELEKLRQQNPGDTSSTAEGGQGHAGDGQQAGTATDPNAYDWDKIAEEYGDEYARMMRERVEREAELERRLQQQEERERQREQAEQAQEAETVQGAIDNLPTLASWQSQDAAMFEAAKAMDNQLREDPNWQHASYQQRFQEVVRRLRPDAPEVSGQPSHSTERGRGGGEPASDTAPPPTSHSDMPAGGTPPDARSQSEQIEDMDPADLEAKLDRMTNEQRQEFLARL